jgi:hypothetical protein
MTKMLAGMNAPGFQGAKLSKLNMGGMGKWMMRRVAKKGNLMPPEDLFEICLAIFSHSDDHFYFGLGNFTHGWFLL